MQSSIHGGACVVVMMINTSTYCRCSKVPRQLDELQQLLDGLQLAMLGLIAPPYRGLIA